MDKKYYIIGGVIGGLVIVVVLVFAMSGGSGAKRPTGKVELNWWKTFEDSGNIQDLISEYQKINKDVTINYVKKNVNDYEAELVDALASGRGPDIMTIHNDWLPKHSDKLAPMPEAMMTLRTYKETFADVATDDFVKESRIYALPMAIDVLALYYNKDILNSAGITQPPKTWAEMVNAVEKITKQSQPGTFSRSGISMGTYGNINRAMDVLLLLMLQNGTKFYSDDLSSASFDQSVTVNNQTYNPGAMALEYYTQFANPAKTTYTWNAKSDFSIDAFTQGKLAMMLSYAYLRPVIADRAPNLNWEVAPAPQIDKSGIKVNYANYWGEAVSKSSPNAEVAWDFLKFITQKEMLMKFYALHKQPSSRKDILTEQFADTEIGVFAEGAPSAKGVYKKDPASFESVFGKMIEDVTFRSFKPEEAIRNAVQQLNINSQR